MEKTVSEKAVKRNKIIRISLNVIFYLIIAIIFVFAIWGLVSRFTGKDTFSLFGYRAYVVVSNSMSRKNDTYKDYLEGHDEQMQIGDLILTKKVTDESQLQEYAIVTYIDSTGKTVVHRIVQVKSYSSGTMYVTRGDANNTTDGERSYDEFTGVYVKNLGQIGKAIQFIQSTYGIAALAGCGFVIFLVTFILDLMNKKEKAKLVEAETNALLDNAEANIEEDKAEETYPTEDENNTPDEKQQDEAIDTDIVVIKQHGEFDDDLVDYDDGIPDEDYDSTEKGGSS